MMKKSENNFLVQLRKRAVVFAAALVAALPSATSASTGFKQSETLNSLDVGKELKDGKVYVVDDLGAVITALPTGNALSVADGATAVIYIPKGITLTVNGGNASGTTGAGAGIKVPATSTLIVTGGGELVARGGNASGGTSGGNGGDGVIIDESGHTYDEWGHAGAGGNGGAGGGGAGAGIGGAGGNGGNGGSGGEWVWYNTDDNFDHDGGRDDGSGNGKNGGRGGDSNAGAVYLLGSLSASATGGDASTTAGSSGSTGSIRVEHWFMGYSHRACGGGGGGGGGSGSGAYGFGAGGVGGGGGGGGGCGATYQVAQGQDDDNSHGGSGGGGVGYVGGKGAQSGGASHWSVTGGNGGYGGSKGSITSAGSIFKDSGVSVVGSYPSLSSASTHAAIEYTLTFSDSHRVNESVTAKLGYALPTAPVPPARPGWAFHGWFTGENGSGTKYFDDTCALVLDLNEYAIVGDLTLYAHWTLEDAVLADTIAINGVALTGGVSQTGDGWTYDGTTGYVQLTKTGGRFVVTGNDPAGEFSIYAHASCTVVMSNLTIDASHNVNRPPFENNPNSSPVLMFAGTNHLYGPVGFPAIYTYGAGTLTIRDGGGVVYATGGANAPGIGGAPGTSTGSLKIEGGTIEAYGGDFGAGIGSAKDGGFGSITISGGIVKATGKGGTGAFGGGAGIGGGAGASVGVIQITGGEVTAIGGNRGSGIGGGSSAAGGDISISGGVVNATGGYAGAGIGGGVNGAGGTIAISGGTVTATGGSGASGVGGGDCGPGGTITISGGEVVARGSEHGAGIGGGRNKIGGTITITGGHVDAAGDTLGAGIGGGSGCVPGTISISGGIVMAVGGTNGCAGVGSGYEGWTYAGTGSISISGGTIYASGSRESPDIGRRSNEHNVIVVFTGGAIYVDKEKVKPDPKDGFEKRVFPVDLDIGLPNSKVTEFELGTRNSGFENIYTNDRGILRIWLASSIYSYGIRMTMEDGSEHVFCFKVADDGTVTSSDFLMVNGAIITGDVDQPATEWTYTKSTSVLALLNNATVSGVSTNGTFRIVVADDTVKNVTLQNLKLLAPEEKYASAITISNAACTVKLVGDNTLAARGSYAAGLEVAPASAVTLTGDGALTAQGGKYGAGIGSRGGFPPPGKIVIESGTIVAQGGEKAAGIGGGVSSTLDKKDNIVISGGGVTAIGGKNAAGIGAGSGKVALAAGAVRISGGTVVATGDQTPKAEGELAGSASWSDLVKSTGNTLETTGNDYTLVIDGGSVVGASGRVSPRPVDSDSNFLYAVAISGLTPGANATVSSFSGDIPSSYNLSGIRVDDAGQICLWLPPTNQTRVIQIDGKYVEAVYPYENDSSHPLYREDMTIDAASSASDTPSEEVVVDDETRHLVLLPGFAPGEMVTLAGLESAGATAVTIDATGRGFFYLPDGDYAFTANGYDASVTVEGSPATVSYTIGVSVNAADIGSLAGDGWAFNISSGQLLISDIGPYILSGTRADGMISVLASTSSNITFDSLTLDASSVAGRTPFEIAPGATVTLELFGENTLKGGEDCAAMQVPDTATLDVLGGDGSLTAIGGRYGAGIGGSKDMAVGSIKIAGSTITAEGGYYAAGIGGGYKGTGSKVAISGGEITVIGGEGAAGIGAGMQGARYTSSGDIVDISGGRIRVAAGSRAVAIGCSNMGSCGAVTISGGTILELYDTTLYLGRHNNARAYAESVTILGGSVRAEVDKIDPAPSNGADNVYCVTLGWCKPNAKVENIVGLASDYGANDLYADADGKIYLWLPDGEYEFDIGFVKYRATVSGADVVASSSHPDEPTGVTVNGVDAWECGGEGWTYSAFTSQLELSGAGPYLLSGANETGNVRVRVEADAAVAFSNLCLKATADNLTPFALAEGVTASFSFSGTNTLAAGTNRAAIEVPYESRVSIGGDGWLYASGGIDSDGYWSYPAIGASKGMQYGLDNVVVEGGNYVLRTPENSMMDAISGAVILGGNVDMPPNTGARDAEARSLYRLEVGGLVPGETVEFSGLPDGCNSDSVYANADGKVYLWLPVGNYGLTANGTYYLAGVIGRSDGNVALNETLDITVNGKNVALLSGEGWEYDISDRAVYITSPGTYALSGTEDKGRVAFYLRSGEGTVNLTLDGLSLSGYTKDNYYSPIHLSDIWTVGDVNITLLSDNSLVTAVPSYSSRYYAGIFVPYGRRLSIGGTGSLYVASTSGAAIGGTDEPPGYWNRRKAGDITISGGRIRAESTGNAAAIGGGNGDTCTSLRIEDGTVEAVSSSAQALGGGAGASATVKIVGGSVKTSDGGNATSAQNDDADALKCVRVSGFSPGEAVVLEGLPDYYGTECIYADADGNIYLHLKAVADEADAIVFTANGVKWRAGVAGDGPIVESERLQAPATVQVARMTLMPSAAALTIVSDDEDWLRLKAKALRVRVSAMPTMDVEHSALLVPEITLNGDGSATAVVPLESGAVRAFYRIEFEE